MKLFVDIGNSNVKWQGSDRFSDSPSSFAYDAENISSQLVLSLKGLSPSKEGVIIASVGREEINREVEKWFREQWRVSVSFLSSTPEWRDLKNGYDSPESLGVDRWFALIGAASRYSYPFLVCDIGSALTIDLVDHHGLHLGGFISPGLDMMVRSLNDETSININSILSESSKSIEQLIPTNTLSAVRDGCVQSIVSMIDGIKTKYAPESLCILTGGGAEVIAGLLESKATIDQNLIFYGMLSGTQNR